MAGHGDRVIGFCSVSGLGVAYRRDLIGDCALGEIQGGGVAFLASDCAYRLFVLKLGSLFGLSRVTAINLNTLSLYT